MKPVLILKFPYASHFGGGEQHTVQLCTALAARNVPFTFAGSCTVLLREFRTRGWPTLRWWAGKEPVTMWSLALFPLTAVVAFLGLVLLLLLYRVLRGTGTVYCLSFTEKVLVTPVARLLGMRVLWMEHVLPGRWLTHSPLRILYRAWSGFATVLTVSRDTAASLERIGLPTGRAQVVYNGIDLLPYTDVHRTTAHWTRSFVIGSVGRLEPEKGMVFLLRAFQHILTMLPQSRLVIVGDGSERGQLEWLARQLTVDRAVQFVGFQQPAKIPAWLRSFDCFVLPSVRREAFGLVVLEALAASCPVVASRLGGIPEIIRDRENGLLVEPGNAEQIAQAVLELYRHPDIAMQRAVKGQAMVEQFFTLEASLSRLLVFFA